MEIAIHFRGIGTLSQMRPNTLSHVHCLPAFLALSNSAVLAALTNSVLVHVCLG